MLDLLKWLGLLLMVQPGQADLPRTPDLVTVINLELAHTFYPTLPINTRPYCRKSGPELSSSNQ